MRPADWSTNAYASATVNGLPPGWTLVTVFVNGIPSESVFLEFFGPLAIVALDVAPDGTVVFWWNSISNHLYTVHQTTNLKTTAFSVLQSALPGTPPFNSYTTSTNGFYQKFWKVSTP